MHKNWLKNSHSIIEQIDEKEPSVLEHNLVVQT
jgi:hypothetical protein